MTLMGVALGYILAASGSDSGIHSASGLGLALKWTLGCFQAVLGLVLALKLTLE